jgi:UDP-2,4-diacetamido-2,4,6-trideoxy-beta-L-altropyranose hydrolase
VDSILIFRTDAGQQIGIGHVMRCLALAQCWQATGGQAIFVMVGEASSVSERLLAEDMRVSYISSPIGSAEDVRRTAEIALQSGARWVVADGYHFASDYQQHLKDAGVSILLVDDRGYPDRCFADVILNQNIHADEKLYPKRESDTRLLLGPKYVLLRKEFLRCQHWRRANHDLASKILLTFGGTDPHHLTRKALEAFKKISIENLQVVVAIGGNNPDYESLLSIADKLSSKIEIKRNVVDMAELMAWADVAVSAAGSTCWELAYMGLPGLVIVAAENQVPVAEGLAAAGVVENLGWYADVSTQVISEAIVGLLQSSKKRRSMSHNGRKMLDGRGAARTRKIILEKDIVLRPVRRDDCDLLWQWANEPAVRAVSFSSESIPWEQHVQWFESKINDESCHLFLAVNHRNAPFGQVKFDIQGKEAVISTTIAKDYRGLGYGSLLIELASRRLFEITGVSQINAYVKIDNDISKRAFEKAGYQEGQQLIIHDQPALQMICLKNKANE